MLYEAIESIFFSAFFSFMESRNNKSDGSISGHFETWKSEVPLVLFGG